MNKDGFGQLFLPSGCLRGQLADRKGFGGAQFLNIRGSVQQLISSHLRERDQMLLRSILFGGVWNGFLLAKARDATTTTTAATTPGSGAPRNVLCGGSHSL